MRFHGSSTNTLWVSTGKSSGMMRIKALTYLHAAATWWLRRYSSGDSLGRRHLHDTRCTEAEAV